MTRRVLSFFSAVVLSGVVGCASTNVARVASSTSHQTAMPTATASERTIAMMHGDSSHGEIRAGETTTIDPSAFNSLHSGSAAIDHEPQFAGPTPQIPIPTAGGRAGIPTLY